MTVSGLHLVPQQRSVYMVLSPHSLGYARTTMRTLFARSKESLNVHFITDSAADKQTLAEAVEQLAPGPQHVWSVTAEDELADAEATIFAKYPNLRAFRHGHPCWRKITDPALLGRAGDELILLDPDLYFPNDFSFEQTPSSGLLLMWQKPNCLLPDDVVRAAFAAKISLARHVDIGVSHWRLSPDRGDLEWIDWLIGKLAAGSNGGKLPRMMHVEAIVWSAIAMRDGGGYLDPSLWHCWHRSQMKRVRRKLGAEGKQILASEAWPEIKCFHAGGEAKWWLPEAESTGAIDGHKNLTAPGRVMPFLELSLRRYDKEQQGKGLLRKLGYYNVFGAKPA